MCDVYVYNDCDTRDIQKVKKCLNIAKGIYASGVSNIDTRESLRKLFVIANDRIPSIHHVWNFDGPHSLKYNFDHLNSIRDCGIKRSWVVEKNERRRHAYAILNLYRAGYSADSYVVSSEVASYKRYYGTNLSTHADAVKEICEIENNEARMHVRKHKGLCKFAMSSMFNAPLASEVPSPPKEWIKDEARSADSQPAADIPEQPVVYPDIPDRIYEQLIKVQPGLNINAPVFIPKSEDVQEKSWCSIM